jgi:hypothetical protein
MAWQMWDKEERRPCSVDETVQFLKDSAKNPTHRKTARHLLNQISSQTAEKAKR